MTGWMMVLGSILLLAVITGLIVLVVWAARHSGAANQPADTDDTAYETLKLRYARGEIDSEQYEKMKAQLSKD